MSGEDDIIIYQIARYLESLKGKNSSVSDENLSKIVNILESIPQVQESSEHFENLSYYPTSLSDIFHAGVEKLSLVTTKVAADKAKSDTKYEKFVDVVSAKGFFDGCEEGSLDFLQRQAKLVSKFSQKAASVGPSREELEAQAEEKKTLGNSAMTTKDYELAIKYYSEALNLSPEGPNSHVYYSNRAAAYCYTNQQELSVLDCEAAIKLKDDFTKAFSRLGFSNFALQRYEEAVAAYEKVAQLEPDNKDHQETLRKARKKLEKSNQVSTSSTSSSSSGGAPDLSALAGLLGKNGGGGGSGGQMPAGLEGMLKNPSMKDAFDKMGGMDGLSSLMKDPSMLAMAQNMMKNPAMMQQAMSMMNGGDPSSMPDLAGLADSFGGASGGSMPTSSSAGSKSKKQPFKGFEE